MLQMFLSGVLLNGKSLSLKENDTMSENKNPILFETSGAVAKITLNRTERKNAINAEMMQQLNDIIERIEKDEHIRSVIITGSSNVFSAGIDLNYAAGILGSDGKANIEVFHENVALLQGTIERFARLELPTIAAISGHCIGLGLELALGADIRMASTNAIFALPEIVLSLVADCGGTTRAMKIIGEAHAKWLLLTGEYIDARRAYEIGLISYLIDEADLMDSAVSLANKLANRNLEVVRQIKRLARASHTTGIPDMLKLEIEAQEAVITQPEFASYLMAGVSELAAKKKR